MRRPLLTTAALLLAGAAAAPAASALPANGPIAYTLIPQDGPTVIYSVAAGGGGGSKRLVKGDQPAWSPDGQTLAFRRGSAVYTADENGKGARRLLRNAAQPAFSNDGRTIAFVRAGSLWTADADGTDARRRVRATGTFSAATPAFDPGDDSIAYNWVKQDVEAPDPAYVEVRTFALPGGPIPARTLNEPSDNPDGWVNIGSSLSWMPEGDQLLLSMAVGPSGDGLGVGAISSSGSGAGVGLTGAAYASWSPDATQICATGPAGLSTAPRGATQATVVVSTPRNATVGDCAWRPKPAA